MAKRVLFVLMVGVFCGAVCLFARAQAVAESGVVHANSGITTGVAKALGGNIQQGLSSAQSQFSYPSRTSRRMRPRARRSRARAHSTDHSPLTISSVVGGPASCAATLKPVAPQANTAAGATSGNCVAKPAAPVANAKSNPDEITVSF